MKKTLFAFISLTILMGTNYAQEQALAFKGAKLITMAGQDTENGLLVVEHGKITYAGSFNADKIPQNAETHDLDGHVIMPGLVDTHSHIGSPTGGDKSHPLSPECRVLDSINVRSSQFQKAQSGGVTVANIMPGSGHLMSGQTLYVKLRDAESIEDILIFEKDGSIAGGMKMANGTNSRRDPPFPGTRAKSAAMVRALFIKAQAYREKMEKAKETPEKTPDRDLQMEALVELLDRKRVVHFHTHRHDDIITVLRLAKEFNLDVVLHHVSDAYQVAKEIAAAETPVSLILIDSPGGKIETKDIDMKNGAVLEKAGALVGFHTDDGITDSRIFLRMGALSVRYGMSRTKALEGLTLAGARMLRLEDRIGSLEAGKDADFIILSGDPFSVYTHVNQTWIDGKKVFDRSNPKDRVYAVGGLGATHDIDQMHVHEIILEEGHK